MMEALDRLNAAEKEIYEYFGYQQQWRVLPIVDHRAYFWCYEGESGRSELFYAKSEKELRDGVSSGEGEYYSGMNTDVFRGPGYTAISMDTQCDGNIWLGVFDNAKELKGVCDGDSEDRDAWRAHRRQIQSAPNNCVD